MAGLIVHSSPLLDGVVRLFELLWEHSSTDTFGAVAGEAREVTRTPLSDEDRATLALLCAGVTDNAAARQLGIASRTWSRRIKRVMRILGVTTRFQAGMEAARRGWI
jgi:DNA-binding NarL/FixJ family response regulator